jgi:hypothetical protein
MFVEAGILVDTKKGLAIPIESLITESNKNYVLLLDSSKKDYSFKKIKVLIGEKSEKYVEIIPDTEINVSSKILTRGVFDIAN